MDPAGQEAQCILQQGASLGSPAHLPRLQDLRNTAEVVHRENDSEAGLRPVGDTEHTRRKYLMGGEHSRRRNVAVRRLTGGRATVNNAHLSPPLPRLKAPAPLLPLYLPQPLGGAAARSRPRPPLEAGSKCRSRTLAGLSVVPPQAP